ncbi:MAG: NifU family protein [Saprospirales bacterium]|nr:MAG: NifU family protein [Saprospirales bacterium]
MGDKQLKIEIETALDTIRPHLAADGGDVEVVSVTEDGYVLIKWLGACKSCEMSQMTLKAGVEQTIIQKLPQIKGVRAIS